MTQRNFFYMNMQSLLKKIDLNGQEEYKEVKFSIQLYNVSIAKSEHKKITSFNSNYKIKIKVNKSHLLKSQEDKKTFKTLLFYGVKSLFYDTTWKGKLE